MPTNCNCTWILYHFARGQMILLSRTLSFFTSTEFPGGQVSTVHFLRSSAAPERPQEMYYKKSSTVFPTVDRRLRKFPKKCTTRNPVFPTVDRRTRNFMKKCTAVRYYRSRSTVVRTVLVLVPGTVLPLPGNTGIAY